MIPSSDPRNAFPGAPTRTKKCISSDKSDATTSLLYLQDRATFWPVHREKWTFPTYHFVVVLVILHQLCSSYACIQIKKISCFHRFKYHGSCTYLFCLLIDGNYQPMYIIYVLNESTIIFLLLWLLSKHYHHTFMIDVLIQVGPFVLQLFSFIVYSATILQSIHIYYAHADLL